MPRDSIANQKSKIANQKLLIPAFERGRPLGQGRRLGAALLVAVGLAARVNGGREALAAALDHLARARRQLAGACRGRVVILARLGRELRAGLSRAVNALAR